MNERYTDLGGKGCFEGSKMTRNNIFGGLVRFGELGQFKLAQMTLQASFEIQINTLFGKVY